MCKKLDKEGYADCDRLPEGVTPLMIPDKLPEATEACDPSPEPQCSMATGKMVIPSRPPHGAGQESNAPWMCSTWRAKGVQ